MNLLGVFANLIEINIGEHSVFVCFGVKYSAVDDDKLISREFNANSALLMNLWISAPNAVIE